MLSIPPAKIISAAPDLISLSAIITAFNPEPHILFIVKHSVLTFNPPKIAACLAGA